MPLVAALLVVMGRVYRYQLVCVLERRFDTGGRFFPSRFFPIFDRKHSSATQSDSTGSCARRF